MKTLSIDEYESFLRQAEIRYPDQKPRIDRELHFRGSPLRIVVVSFAEDEKKQHITDVFDKVLALDETWIIAPRYGNVADLALLDDAGDALAAAANETEKTELAAFLCGCFEPLIRMEVSDFYLISGDGKVIVTYDHHTHSDGLAISLNDLDKTRRLLIGLNEIGAELEMFSARK